MFQKIHGFWSGDHKKRKYLKKSSIRGEEDQNFFFFFFKGCPTFLIPVFKGTNIKYLRTAKIIFLKTADFCLKDLSKIP